MPNLGMDALTIDNL